METEFPDVFSLDDERKVELIDALISSISSDRCPSPISDDIQAMLDEEIATFESSRPLGRPWREVMDELDQRHV